jgi:L-fuculose-phosphate aldolase
MTEPMPPSKDSSEHAKRRSIVEHCIEMNRAGINQGTSGNISVRHGGGLLITPTSMPYASMECEDIAFLSLEGEAAGRRAPSSEWRFHRDILAARPDIDAVVHAHPTYCTALALHGRGIPPVHYMIAVFGGDSVRCAPYAIYGSQKLSDHAVNALEGRTACLLAHHGMIALGVTLEQAFWRAVELETLARQYHAALLIGEPPRLSTEQIEAVMAKIGGYALVVSGE